MIKIAETSANLNAATAVEVLVGDLTSGDGTTEDETATYVVSMLSDGTALSNATEYFFQVAAVNSVEGPYSAEVSATPAAATAPDAPTNLMATAVSETEINLSWDAPSDTGGSAITSYDLEYSANGSDSWMDLTPSGTSFSDNTGLNRGTTRHYRVAAVNRVGTGDYSTVVSATTHDVPDAPMSVRATPGEAEVTLSWAVPADRGVAITKYLIKIAENSAGLTGFTAVEVPVSEIINGEVEGTNVNYVVNKVAISSGDALSNATEYLLSSSSSE